MGKSFVDVGCLCYDSFALCGLRIGTSSRLF